MENESPEFRDAAFDEVGDAPGLGGLLVQLHYNAELSTWEAKKGTKAIQAERNPIVLSAFLFTVLDLQVLHKQKKIEETKHHFYRALRHANNLVGRPVSGSIVDASTN